MKNKLYKGVRGNRRREVTVDGVPLNPRLDLRNHNPPAFNWGHLGAGASQLALAILADHLGDDRQAAMLYWRFGWAVVARMPIKESWELTSEEVDLALREMAEDS